MASLSMTLGHQLPWCQFGPADGFPRYDCGRAYGKLALEADEVPQWRISCLFADKHRRREGLAKCALHSAMVSIRKRGGGAVEAFPLDVPGPPTRNIPDRSRCISAKVFEKSPI